MYDGVGKLLNDIKSMYVSILASVREKEGEIEYFRIDSGVKQVFIMSPWLFNVYMEIVMKEVKMWKGRREVKFQEERREWRLPGLLYTDDLVLFW